MIENQRSNIAIATRLGRQGRQERRVGQRRSQSVDTLNYYTSSHVSTARRICLAAFYTHASILNPQGLTIAPQIAGHSVRKCTVWDYG